MSAVVEQDVLRFDVSVHHTCAVSRRQAIQRFPDDSERLTYAEGDLLVHFVTQIHAMDVFHDEIIQSIEFAGVVDLHDVRIGYRGRGTSFAPEAFHELIAFRPLRQLSVHDFYGDGAFQPFIDGLIHRGHATVGDSADNPVPVFYDLAYGVMWGFIHD